MGKGGYLGGGTVFGPDDLSWFGNSGVKAGVHPDAAKVERRKAHPLTADAERQIGKLRIDIAGLEQQLARLDLERSRLAGQLTGSRSDLNRLLQHHGLPLEPNKVIPTDETPSTKTTRHERRKRTRERVINGKR